MSFSLARSVIPWSHKRKERAQRIAELRQRDGDECRRCRRALRFDLADGHDLGPSVEAIAPPSANQAPALDNLCLTHRRCNGEPADLTAEVQERVRRKNEAELFANAKRQKRRA
ncbi:MAG: hypothetical protein ACJ8FO_01975 [Sphingomicrobium sp.]